MSFSLPNTFSLASTLLTAVCCLLLFSCGEEAEIRSYEIPTEYTGPVVTWELPEELGENPDISGPMAGSFHVKTDLGPMGRIGSCLFVNLSQAWMLPTCSVWNLVKDYGRGRS